VNHARVFARTEQRKHKFSFPCRAGRLFLETNMTRILTACIALVSLAACAASPDNTLWLAF